jgi:hypothetical protein
VPAVLTLGTRRGVICGLEGHLGDGVNLPANYALRSNGRDCRRVHGIACGMRGFDGDRVFVAILLTGFRGRVVLILVAVTGFFLLHERHLICLGGEFHVLFGK